MYYVHLVGGFLMYVCICRAVTDRQIRKAVAEGVRTMRELRLKLGVCSACGKCGGCAKEILDSSVQPPMKAQISAA
jgi:bacterioferritin-associated ferredoxin